MSQLSGNYRFFGLGIGDHHFSQRKSTDASNVILENYTICFSEIQKIYEEEANNANAANPRTSPS